NYPGPEDRQISLSSTPLDSATQTHISFLAGEDSQTLSIANTGGGILLWRLNWKPQDAANVPWLTFSSKQGVTTIESDVITLGVDRRNLSQGTYHGTLVLETSAGNREFNVVANIGPLQGEWRGK